jgi:hypothetical protein
MYIVQSKDLGFRNIFYENETFLDEWAEKSCQDMATFMEDTVWSSRVKLSYRGSESEGAGVLLPRQAGRTSHTCPAPPPPRNPFERPEGGEKMAVGVVVRAR